MLLVIGDSNADAAARVPWFPREGDDVPLGDLGWSSGGAGVNVATAFARLGGAARLVSCVGDDAAARVALGAAERAGVDLSAVQREGAVATGVCVILVSPSAERTFLSFRGANVGLRAPASEVWSGATRVHVCGHALLEGAQRATTRGVIEESRARGAGVSVDLCLPWIERDGGGVKELFPAFEVVFANEVELCRLVLGRRVDRPSAEEVEGAAVTARGWGARTVVVKRGAAGALVVTERVESVAAFRVVAVDSTAAGDSFVAAYLWASEQGHEEGECARIACAAGAITAARTGSAEAAPTLAELTRFLDSPSESERTLERT